MNPVANGHDVIHLRGHLAENIVTHADQFAHAQGCPNTSLQTAVTQPTTEHGWQSANPGRQRTVHSKAIECTASTATDIQLPVAKSLSPQQQCAALTACRRCVIRE